MAYNPYNAVKEIYNLKGLWDAADKAGDDAKKKTAAGDAVRWYQELRANGYGSVADELQASNYTQAKATHDYYAKTGRTKTRPYFYDLGKAYGLAEADVDKLVGWDDTAGEITFGGKNIGRPDAVVDGVSYWGDTSVLDKAFSDYVDRTGLTRSKETAVNQENEHLFKKYRQEYDELIDANPFETETGKAILQKYDLAGLQGRDNELAGGASSNGGNVDSFAAANALRQQATLVNQGQMVALEAHQQKIDNARALLSDMGVNIDRVYNQDETSKNNAVSRDVATSESTGFATDNQLKASSSLWNKDGSLADTGIDYQAQINEMEKKYNSATSESEKQTYALALKLLEMGRNDKISQTGSKETKTYKWQNLVENANMKITKAQIESAEKLVGLNTDAAIRQIGAQTEATKELYNNGLNPDGTPIKKEEPEYDVISIPESYDSDIQKIATGDEASSTPVNGVDFYGANLLKAFLKEYPYGESKEEFVNYAVLHSKEHHVDLKQLIQVCKYIDFTATDIINLVTDKYEDATETYTRPRDGATWSDGIQKKSTGN